MVIGLSACNAKNEYVPPPPPKVTVAQPVQQDVTNYLELTGNTSAFQSVDLQARVQGFLESINYKDGAIVKKGDLLFGIQRDTYQAQLDQAKGSLASAQAEQINAQADYQRKLTLSRQDFSTQAQLEDTKKRLDQAVASVTGAQASLDLATINLSYTQVTAPFDGVATNHLVDIGALVGVSGPTKLATVVQADPLYVYFNVSEAQVLAIKASFNKQGLTRADIDLHGIAVEIGLQSEEGYPHKGELDYVAPQVDSATGTLQGRAIFDNKGLVLLPGLFVRVRAPIGHSNDALLVRDDAIGTSQQGSYVLVVAKDDVIEEKLVKTGQRLGRLRVIETGLEPGDWVVTEGIQRAAPGSKVSPEKAVMQASAADSAPANGPAAKTPAEPPAKAKTP
ncbi:RND family efflux transporter, MFP subunit [Rhizobiales bacterium GAS191]|jgi:multidrug efflux system membrane fusion protein|nr:RND family efflux transporter, MFP subunit [Rhizobiales bacterium GAS113]SEE92565.1 RND family efflux transporter, MFP subunit [Rhizobiales bacterium GAS191]